MKTYKDENGKKVKAKNYQDAAEKLYGVALDIRKQSGTYTYRHNGYADVKVYKKGDKVGTFYGVQAATPKKHRLTIEGAIY
jgi:hypothetical protein